MAPTVAARCGECARFTVQRAFADEARFVEAAPLHLDEVTRYRVQQVFWATDLAEHLGVMEVANGDEKTPVLVSVQRRLQLVLSREQRPLRVQQAARAVTAVAKCR